MIRNGEILILADIVIDKELPKHKKEKKNNFNVEGVSIDGDISEFNPISGVMITPNGSDSNLDFLEYQYQNAPTLFLKFKIWSYKKIYSTNFDFDGNKPKKSISLEDLKEFFTSIKNSVKELDEGDINEVLEKYGTVLLNAKENNQTALLERVEDYAETLKYELMLSPSKFNTYLTEEDIVKFHDKSAVHDKFKTGLHLTYIKNFVKIIPYEVTSLKNEANKLKVFDNYVILHYDPSGKAVEETKAEKEKRKDPVLFGVIKNSKKLYYIGDWIDDYCDLTLDVIIKKLGKEVNVLNIDNVKKNIDKI